MSLSADFIPYVDTAEWLKNTGAAITKDGTHAILFKSVRENLLSNKSFYELSYITKEEYKGGRMVDPYEPGVRLTDPMFKESNGCGKGLHLSPSPQAAWYYHSSHGCRFLACEVRIDDIIAIGSGVSQRDSKCKVRTLRVLREVKPDFDVTASNYAVNGYSSTWSPQAGHPFRGRGQRQGIVVDSISGNRVYATRANGTKTSMNRSSLRMNFYGEQLPVVQVDPLVFTPWQEQIKDLL